MWDFFIFSTMRKHTLLVAVLAVLMSAYGCGNSLSTGAIGESSSANQTQTTVSTQGSTEADVSEDDVARTLRYLSSDELAGRKTGTEGIEKAATFIEDVFRKYGIEPYFQTYRDSFQVEGVTGYNLVGLKEGTDPDLKDEYIIIGAHYDHIGEGKPVAGDSIANGANDNASGTTAVLELAKHFANVDTGRSILFTLFSAEEMGLVGAKRLAERLKAEDIDLYLMFNIEMIGVPMEDRSYEAYLTGYELSNLAEKFNEYAGQEVLGFLPEAKEYRLFRRSDNYPFYEQFGVPAQTMSTFDFTNYEYYHHVNDEFEHMNISHMADLIEKIIPGIEAMANTASREIEMKE